MKNSYTIVGKENRIKEISKSVKVGREWFSRGYTPEVIANTIFNRKGYNFVAQNNQIGLDFEKGKVLVFNLNTDEHEIIDRLEWNNRKA